jgi:hypothetical protein
MELGSLLVQYCAALGLLCSTIILRVCHTRTEMGMVKAPSVLVLQYYCGAADDSDSEQRHGNGSHTTVLFCIRNITGAGGFC